MRIPTLSARSGGEARGWRAHAAALGLVAGAAGVLAILLACASTPAMQKQAAPPVPPPPPAATPSEPAAPKGAGCSKDMDCKGDRICDKGECVSPR
jgi:hypothetical protein